MTNAVRPTITFKSLTFSGGQTLHFDDDEIIVFVGPNNAGKSQALRDLHSWVAKSFSQTIIKNAELRKIGSHSDFKDYLERHALKRSVGVGTFAYCGMGYQIHQAHVPQFEAEDRHSVANFFSALISTESRIVGANAAPAISLHDEPPQHPIHLLMIDDKLADSISELFRRAYGEQLTVFRAGGGRFPLYVGTKPQKGEGEDELSLSFVTELRRLSVPLEAQGDGMRSFATVLLHTLVSDSHTVQMLDEPEAFLHPPQARLLGEYISTQRRSKSQLFLATHSTDILDGLMLGGLNKIRLIRIQREGSTNRVKELSKERLQAISGDPLMRYSGVLDGIFYQRVIIAEADSDCLFYQSILRTPSVVGDQNPDVLFIHASGKHRMAKLAETLRELDVPVSVVADLDLLCERGTFQMLFEKLGGDWSCVSSSWEAIKKSVEERRPPLTSDQVKQAIQSELDMVGGPTPFSKDVERKIKQIFKTLSPWSDLKQSGRRGLPGGQPVKHFDALVSECEKVGLWLVPEGELEGFCRSIEAKHGPAFVEKVIESRHLDTDEELESARRFVKRIWDSGNQPVEH